MIDTLTHSLHRSWTSVPAILRRNFLLDFVAALFIGVYVATISSFAPVVARRLGADVFMLSLLTAAPSAGNLIAVLASHYLQGRRKMPFMVLAWTFGRGVFLLTMFIVTPEPFVLLVIVSWFLLALPLPGYVEMMSQIYPAPVRGRAMAYVRVGFTSCATVLTPIVGRLLDITSYQLLFPIAAVFGILSSLTFGRVTVTEIAQTTRHDLLEPGRILRKDKHYRDYSIAFFVYGLGQLMTAPLIPLLLVDELHLDYSAVGLLGMINSLFWMAFYVVWGRTVDQHGGLWTLRVNFFLTIFVSLAFLFAQGMWLAAIAYVFTGITVAGVDLGWLNAVMQFARKEEISNYTALHAFLVGVRGILAPLAGMGLAMLPWVGLRGVFLVSTVLVLVGWLLVRRVSLPAVAME
jgi:MFS transporter, DHA1 family, inner membrane transport protein